MPGVSSPSKRAGGAVPGPPKFSGAGPASTSAGQMSSCHQSTSWGTGGIMCAARRVASGAVASQRGVTATSPSSSFPSSRNSAQNLVPKLPAAAANSSVKARTSTATSFQLLDSSAKGLGTPVRRSVPGRPVAAYGQPDTSSPEPMTIDVALLEQDEKIQGEYHARAPPRLPSQRRAYAAVAAPAGPSGAAPGSTPTMSAHPRARPRQPHCDLPLVVEYPPEAVRDGFTFLQLNADYPGKRRLLGVAQGTTCGLSSSSHRPCRLLYRGRSSELSPELSPELSRRCDHLS